MVWNVQDGPSRMNNCEMTPKDYSASSKIIAMDSAINAGLSINMKYYEIYLADLKDSVLDSILSVLHERIKEHMSNSCDDSLFLIRKEQLDEILIFPTRQMDNIWSYLCKRNIQELTYPLDIVDFPDGIFIVKARIGDRMYTEKILKIASLL